jgi:hypothetical protein
MLTSTRQPAANLARERLLIDPVMRRNKPTTAPALEIPAITTTFPVPNNDQKRHVMQIARSFKDYYLAHVTYQGDLTVALMNPVNEYDEPLEIHVGANGDISVISCGETHPSLGPAVRRILLVSSLFLILALTLVIWLV